MARSKIQPGDMIDRFTYTPGDGYRYRWDGAVIVVERIVTDLVTGRVTFRETGDTVPVPATATATAMIATVRAWRQAQ